MPRRRNPFPTPRQHKGAAVIDVYDGPTRRTVTLGPWGSDLAQQEYERLLARLRIGKPAVQHAGAGPADTTVAEALVRYTDHIEAYYRNPDGTPTGTAEDIKITLGYLKRSFAALPLREFDIRCFKALRQALIDDKRVRNQVNRRAGMVRSFIRWCVEEELPVASGVLEKLRAVKALAPGRDGVPEGEVREPADPAAVEKVLPFLPPMVAGAFQVVRLTGARPSEILKLKPCELDRSGKEWELTPTRHKGSWRGKGRTIYLGPEAQAVLASWLLKNARTGRLRLQPCSRRGRTERGAIREPEDAPIPVSHETQRDEAEGDSWEAPARGVLRPSGVLQRGSACVQEGEGATLQPLPTPASESRRTA